MALRWSDVDLKAGLLRAERSWDETHGPVETKNRDRRIVPVTAGLREILAAERLAERVGTALCLAAADGGPFRPRRLQERADREWAAAGLERVTLHDCRHTIASFAIAAGANAKALSAYMGHSSVVITLDRYGHLMPGNEQEFAGLLDAYLGRTVAQTVAHPRKAP